MVESDLLPSFEIDMSTNADAINKTVAGYLRYIQTHDQTYEWAVSEVDALISDPKAISIVFELVEGCDTDKQIALIAAGPLEDLINLHLHLIENELTVLVRKHEKMRKAICGVWAQEGTEARKIIDNILQQFNLQYGSL